MKFPVFSVWYGLRKYKKLCSTYECIFYDPYPPHCFFFLETNVSAIYVCVFVYHIEDANVFYCFITISIQQIPCYQRNKKSFENSWKLYWTNQCNSEKWMWDLTRFFNSRSFVNVKLINKETTKLLVLQYISQDIHKCNLATLIISQTIHTIFTIQITNTSVGKRNIGSDRSIYYIDRRSQIMSVYGHTLTSTYTQ